MGLLLVLGVALAWFLLDPWRPLPLPGPAEAVALESEGLLRDPSGSAEGVEPRVVEGSGPARRLVPEGGVSALVLDAATHRPLARAEFFLWGRPPRLIGRTGSDGRVGLPEGMDPAHLLVRRPGSLGLFLGLDTPFMERLRSGVVSNRVRLALAPDPVTRPLMGQVQERGKAPGPATVTLFCLEPIDPERPPGVPPALEPAFRVSLAVERMCRSAAPETPWELGLWDPRVATQTDERGRFSFRTLSTGCALLCATTAAGTVARAVVRLPAESEVELSLRPGSWLRPLAPGAGRIQAHAPDGWPSEARSGGLLGPFLPGEEVRLLARWPDGQEASLSERAPEPGQVAEVRFKVPGGGRVWEGRAVALGSGRPLAGVAVRVLGGDTARTCEEGRFRLELGGAVGPAVAFFEGDRVERRRIDLEPSGLLPERVELLPEGREAQVAAGLLTPVSGRVLAATGLPAAGALVAARPLDPSGLEGLRVRGITQERADPQGRFRLYLPTPGRFVLEATHLDLGRGALELALGSGGSVSNLVLLLAPPARLVGQALDARTGAPLPGLLLICSRPGQPTIQARTDEQGHFSLLLPVPGSWHLEAHSEKGLLGSQDLECTPAQTLQLKF